MECIELCTHMRKLIQKQPSFYFKNTCAELSKTVFPGIVITGSRGGGGGPRDSTHFDNCNAYNNEEQYLL